MDDGLKRVYNDKEVLEMSAIVVENRSIDLFAIHGSNNTLETYASPKKMTSPQKSSQTDPLYEPDIREEIVTEESFGSDAELEDDFEDAGLEDDFEVELDVEDDVQKDTLATVAGQGTNVASTSELNEDGYVNKYADSDDEELIPNEDGDEYGTFSKKKARKLVVHERTDWNPFEWKLVLVIDQESRPEVFKRFFVCFDGIIKGWTEGFRKVLCVDACFLKTFLGGQLLATIERGENDQMYPASWAVVEEENNQS
ncbi:Pescadillo-like protein [Bienertia sinuspersici]